MTHNSLGFNNYKKCSSYCESGAVPVQVRRCCIPPWWSAQKIVPWKQAEFPTCQERQSRKETTAPSDCSALENLTGWTCEECGTRQQRGDERRQFTPLKPDSYSRLFRSLTHIWKTLPVYKQWSPRRLGSWSYGPHPEWCSANRSAAGCPEGSSQRSKTWSEYHDMRRFLESAFPAKVRKKKNLNKSCWKKNQFVLLLKPQDLFNMVQEGGRLQDPVS